MLGEYGTLACVAAAFGMRVHNSINHAKEVGGSCGLADMGALLLSQPRNEVVLLAGD